MTIIAPNVLLYNIVIRVVHGKFSRFSTMQIHYSTQRVNEEITFLQYYTIFSCYLCTWICKLYRYTLVIVMLHVQFLSPLLTLPNTPEITVYFLHRELPLWRKILAELSGRISRVRVLFINNFSRVSKWLIHRCSRRKV